MNHQGGESESALINLETEQRSGKVVWRYPMSDDLYPQGSAIARLRTDLASEDASDEEPMERA
jgi:hypothetical protein